MIVTKEQYNNDIQYLAEQLELFSNDVHFCFTNVFPVARGGYYPAIKIAEYLGLPVILDESNITNTTIVVDDLCDSGETAKRYIERCAVAVVYSKGLFTPSDTQYGLFIGKNIDNEWIKLPDEHEECIQDNIRRIFQFIGEDAEREGLKGTPERIERMFKEIFRGYDPAQKPKITTFANGSDNITYDNMVVDSGDYYSLCEHHMLPFFGKYWFAYIPNPNGRILGISKIGRVVDYCAAKLQVQERLTYEIVKMLSDALCDENAPIGIALVMKGHHLCKEMRGARKKGIMTSSYMTGRFREDAALRAEFMRFVNE